MLGHLYLIYKLLAKCPTGPIHLVSPVGIKVGGGEDEENEEE